MERGAQVFLRPIGNPLPLGFLALAAATVLVSALQLEWIPPAEGRAVALILLAFVFPLQLLVSILGFLARDVVAGTGMGVLAGSWLSVGLVTLDSTPGSTSDALGLFLLIAGLAMLVPASVATGGKFAAAVVLGTTAIRFATTGLYQLSASQTWADVAGIIGLALCGAALYAAMAMALEDGSGRTVFPLGRRGEGIVDARPPGLAREAGVREQL